MSQFKPFGHLSNLKITFLTAKYSPDKYRPHLVADLGGKGGRGAFNTLLQRLSLLWLHCETNCDYAVTASPEEALTPSTPCLQVVENEGVPQEPSPCF